MNIKKIVNKEKFVEYAKIYSNDAKTEIKTWIKCENFVFFKMIPVMLPKTAILNIKNGLSIAGR